jgi:low affinity Fe/Cu permease
MREENRTGRPFNGKGVVETLSQQVTNWSGRSGTLLVVVGAFVAWALTGPYFHYSDTWQLMANTATSLVTTLMVFLIQRAQNKDSRAIQLKLNEVVAAIKGASNRLIAVEELSESELRELHDRYVRLAERAQVLKRPQAPVSVEAVEGTDPPSARATTPDDPGPGRG